MKQPMRRVLVVGMAEYYAYVDVPAAAPDSAAVKKAVQHGFWSRTINAPIDDMKVEKSEPVVDGMPKLRYRKQDRPRRRDG